MNKPSIPKGTRDFSSLEMQRRNYIFNTISDVYRLYGYKQIETPALELLIFLSYHYLTDILPMWANFILTGIEGLLLYVIIMVLLKGLNKNDGASMPFVGRFFR